MAECLEYDPLAKSPIGNDTKTRLTLYGNYFHWASLNNIPPISKYRFSDLLLDHLISLKWKGVEKKRTNKGVIMQNVKLKI